MAKKKPNLSSEASEANGKSVQIITRALLQELCPAAAKQRLKGAKSMAQLADLIFALNRQELKYARDNYNAWDNFVGKLEQFFLQELPEDQTSAGGKHGKCERKTKDVPVVEDWNKLQKHILKTGEFELLQRRVNDKAVAERWAEEERVPGVGVFHKPVISVTAVKGGK